MITLADLDLQTITDAKLGSLLINAKKAYYTTAKPIMDDHTYDTLEDLLKKRNPHHRLFSKVGNPNFDTGWTKQKHTFPLGSLNKVSSFTDLKHYLDLKKLANNINFMVQPKCDGLSLALNYQSGKLVSAVTRGDGFIGDLITQNTVYMKNLVRNIATKDDITVRCEILVTLTDFAKLNKISDEVYTNPRNAASGISQRLDSLYADFCSLYAVDIFSKTLHFDTEAQKIDQLKKLGFKTVKTRLCQNYQQIEDIYQLFLTKKRQNYAYEIDGLVIKINQLGIQHQLGVQANRPKGQVAYKFPADTNQTVIKDINWQVGPLGFITPVATVEPVILSGATINKASLANHQLLKQKNVNIGDIVQISRRGDVIPYIEKVVTKVSSGHDPIPTKCPSCHTTLEEYDKYLLCPNYQNCLPQVIGRLNLFCRKLDILGISKKTIKKLYKRGLVTKPADFFKLKVSDIAPIDGLGDKSAQNIMSQINQKKNLTLIQLFASVSIPELSSARLKQIIKAGYNTSNKILAIRVGDLEDLAGFQITLAQKIVDGIAIRKQDISQLLDQVSIKTKSTIQKLANLSFVITGSLSQPRSHYEKLIEDNGGTFSPTLTKKTSYLITSNPKAKSSKLAKAKKLNLSIINEDQFNKLLNGCLNLLRSQIGK